MVARIALTLNPPIDGARPLNPLRDLGQVADLLELAFAGELDAGGRRMINEARVMSRTGPLIHLFLPWSNVSTGFTPGFVWEEDGNLIGNMTLIQSKRHSKTWHVANVAVHPEHRRRGIATKLLETTFEHIRSKGAQIVTLQVKESNPAVSLYRKLGFQPLGVVVRWELNQLPAWDRISTNGREVRKQKRKEWITIWRLFRSVPPAARGWPDPLTKKDFQPRFFRDLGYLLGGEITTRWVAPASIARVLDGYIELSTRPGIKNKMTLRVRPVSKGQVEGDLLQKALEKLEKLPSQTAVIDHPAGEDEAEERLNEAGFCQQRRLLLMQLVLNG